MDQRSVRIPIGTVELHGDLVLPERARGLVLFAHGSGSSRGSPRNRFVARVLNEGGLGTMLIDLLTADEARTDGVTAEPRFDLGFLARRLIDVTTWLADSGTLTRDLRVGIFGASTGAAAAFVAAAQLGSMVSAMVSRGGRTDLASAALRDVVTPTLLIVGGRDVEVLRRNQQALAQLDCAKRLYIVPGATHLFAEPHALEQVARLAREWFVEYLVGDAVALPSGEAVRPA
jgi:putative phosphoribosyl transferase